MPDDPTPDLPDTPAGTDGSRTVAQPYPPQWLVESNPEACVTHSASVGRTSAERYELLEEIARGGMGVVYRARDHLLEREIGVKTLLQPPQEGSVIASRFYSEAHITGQLQHPNIPPVHDRGALPDGRPYLAMKLIKGWTLDALLKERVEPVHERGRYLAIFEQIAQGVAYAHAHRVIHRDLKPLNVMVGKYGEVQVMDWGLAKVLRDGTAEAVPSSEIGTRPTTEFHPSRDENDETHPGSIFGTPAYMPREQAIGAVDQIDARSDVFSLGGILCVVLTGKPPYVGADGESTRQLAALAKLDDCFARLDVCGSEPDLIALCKRCLSAERDARPRDAGAVADAVAAFRSEVEQRARRAELDRVRADGEREKAELRTAEQRKRRKVQMALLASVMVIVAGGAAGARWQYTQARDLLKDEERRTRDEHDRKAHNRDAVLAALGRCERALREGNVPAAAAAFEEIERRLPEGGAEDCAPRTHRCREDLALLRELDRINVHRWTPQRSGRRRADDPSQSYPEDKEVVALWEAAFTRFGLDLKAAPAPGAVRSVTGSPIREQLLEALDLWLALSRSKHVADLLTEADPDEYRNAVRAAVAVAGRRQVLRNLLARPEALRQPVRFVIAIGHLRYAPAHLRQDVLRRAAQARPNDLTVLMALGQTYRINQPEGAAERVRWYQAAVAAHPHFGPAWFELGLALCDLGDYHAGADAFRRGLVYDPQCADAHFNLALTLLDLNDARGALAALKQAVDYDAEDSSSFNALGWLLATGPDDVRNTREALDHAARACELSKWEDPTCLDTLAAACASAGDYDSAVKYQKLALERPGFEKAEGPDVRARLVQYEGRKPYRDPKWIRPPTAPAPREVKRP